MSNPCYSAGVAHIPDPNASPLKLVGTGFPTAYATGSNTNGGVGRSGLNTAVLLTQTGVSSGTPDSFSVTSKIQSGPTINGPWTDVPDADQAIVTSEFGEAQVTVSLAGAGAYVRVVVTAALVGGTSPTIEAGGSMVLSP